jgi:hypothetical protein
LTAAIRAGGDPPGGPGGGPDGWARAGDAKTKAAANTAAGTIPFCTMYLLEFPVAPIGSAR